MEELERLVATIASTAADSSDLDIVWVIVSAVLVFFMQVGFAMVSLVFSAIDSRAVAFLVLPLPSGLCFICGVSVGFRPNHRISEPSPEQWLLRRERIC